jgi:hypothetical protein
MPNIQIIVGRDGVETISALVDRANQLEVLKFIETITPAINRLHADARNEKKGGAK